MLDELPVNILSLGEPCLHFYELLTHPVVDGGGVKGLSELVILHQIMLRLQDRIKGSTNEKDVPLPKPCDFFDLIGGTSTGGQVPSLPHRRTSS